MPTDAQFGATLTGALANDTVDLYTFHTSAGGEVTFDLDLEQIAQQARSIKLRLLDANGREVFSQTTSDDKSWQTVVPKAGAYKLAIADAGFVDKNLLDYSVRTSFSTEPNVIYERAAHDTAAKAMSIVSARPVVGALQTREADYYKVSASQDGQLYVSFAHPDGPGASGSAMSIEIIDAATGRVLLTKHLTGSQLITADIPGDGNYLVKLADTSAQDHGIYSMIVMTSNKSTSEFIRGSAASDLFKASAGHDTYVGNGGFDTVQYDRKAADYRLAFSDAGLSVEAIAGSGGRDVLLDIGRVKFADRVIDFGNATDAAALLRLYDAAFDRAPDEAGLGFWMKALENGMSHHQVVHAFVDSAEFVTEYPAELNHTELVTAFYRNVLNRAPDAGGLAYWVDALDRGTDVAFVLERFSESAEHQALLVGQLTHGVSYIPYVA